MAVCPACLAALVASAATSVSTLWAFKRVVVEDIGMKKTSTEARHKVAAREEWLAARLEWVTIDEFSPGQFSVRQTFPMCPPALRCRKAASASSKAKTLSMIG